MSAHTMIFENMMARWENEKVMFQQRTGIDADSVDLTEAHKAELAGTWDHLCTLAAVRMEGIA